MKIDVFHTIMDKSPLIFSGLLRAMFLLHIRRKNLLAGFSFLLFTVLLLNHLIYPNNPTHFKSEENELYWQKNYYSRMTFEQLREKVKDSAIFDKIDISGNKISGELRPRDFDLHVIRMLSIPLYMKTYKYIGFVSIDFYKGKYTVNCSKIVLVNNNTSIPADLRENVNLEKYALENGTNHFKEPFKKNVGKALEYTLLDMFAFK